MYVAFVDPTNLNRIMYLTRLKIQQRTNEPVMNLTHRVATSSISFCYPKKATSIHTHTHTYMMPIVSERGYEKAHMPEKQDDGSNFCKCFTHPRNERQTELVKTLSPAGFFQKKKKKKHAF
jgi:hypothetical protein